MTAANRNILGTTAVLVVLVLTIVVWHFAPRKTNPLLATTGDTRNVADFDQFQQDLATRVLDKLGAGSDFSAIVATTAYPVGTLLRATGSVPANLESPRPRRRVLPGRMKKRYPRGRGFFGGRLRGCFTDVADYTWLPVAYFS